jgi:N-acetylmuramoyl-L-alanine amidase
MRSKQFLFGVILSSILSIVFITSAASSNFFQPKILEVAYDELTKDAKRQVDCLAENIYHEAKSEPASGQIAVALVTLNRVNDERFPKDICGVVKQKTKIQERTVCQFSWYCTGVRLNKNSEYYQEALKHALHVYANYELIDDFTRGSLFYHADYVNPGWKLLRTVVIGRHIFYKEGRK